MSISGIESISSTYVQTSDSSSSTIESEDFLTLLCAQLENQDPLDPMDGTEYVSQLCDLSSLEQMQLVNENLGNLLTYQSAIIDQNATDLIGKTVKAYDNSINLSEGASKELQFQLEGDASGVYIYIYDSSGELVKEISETGQFDAGEQTITWNGTDDEGNALSDGEYTFEVQAVDDSGSSVDASAFITGEVTSVYFGSGSATLAIGDKEIALTDVIEVGDG